MGDIPGFRGALGIIYVLTILSFVGVWGGLGSVITMFTQREASLGLFVGALLGGGVGWLVAAYITGVGHTLLAINDHLKVLRDGLEAPTDPNKRI